MLYFVLTVTSLAHVVLSLCEYDGEQFGTVTDYVLDASVSMSILYAILLDVVVWILYFDWKRAGQILKTKWTDHLLLLQKIHDKAENNEPWTIKYAKICGNAKFLLIFAVLYWFVSFILLLYVNYLFIINR